MLARNTVVYFRDQYRHQLHRLQLLYRDHARQQYQLMLGGSENRQTLWLELVDMHQHLLCELLDQNLL
jgi:hypothetical protein